MNRFMLITIQLMAIGIIQPLMAGVSVTEYLDRQQWEQAVGSFTTITFTEIPPNSILHNQYLSSGIQFSDMNAFTRASSNLYPSDGHGATGAGYIRILLTDGFQSMPLQWIAVDFHDLVVFHLYRDSKLVYSSSKIWAPHPWPNNHGFAGFVSSEPFDEVRILDPLGFTNIDNLYFGIPAPGALAIFGFAAFAGTGRRRRP